MRADPRQHRAPLLQVHRPPPRSVAPPGRARAPAARPAASLARTASASPSSRYRTISRSSFMSSFGSSIAARPRSQAARARARWSSMNAPDLRHEDRRDPVVEHLVEGIVAGGGDGEVRGRGEHGRVLGAHDPRVAPAEPARLQRRARPDEHEMQRVGPALEKAAERLDLRAAVRRHPAAEKRDGEPVEASPEALGEPGPQVARGLRATASPSARPDRPDRGGRRGNSGWFSSSNASLGTMTRVERLLPVEGDGIVLARPATGRGGSRRR